MALTLPGGVKVKGFILIALLVVSSSANALEVIRETAEPAQLTNFTENLYGKDLKACYVGSVTEVCSEVKATVRRANLDLGQAGAEQRFEVEACAQNPDKAMVIYFLRSKRNLAISNEPKVRKTVYLEPCGGDQIRRLTVTFN